MLVTDLLQDLYDAQDATYEYLKVLPTTCPTCGAATEISPVLTTLRCSNPRCYDKMVMRIKALCGDLGIMTFGESTIEKFLDTYSVDSPMDIFALEIGDSLSPDVSPAVSECIIQQLKAKNKMMIWEYVMYSNIPFVRTSAKKIFDGYSSLEEAFKDIEEGGIPFIQKRLGSSSRYASAQAIKVYNSLMTYKDDLLNSTTGIELINTTGVTELDVVCSDQVGGRFAKKNDFYTYVHNTFGEKIRVNFLSSVTKSIDYLVWAGADGSPARYTSKVQKVEGYNAKGCNIPILTAEQFISLLEKM